MSTVRARPVPVLLAVIVVLVGALLGLSIRAFAFSATPPSFTSIPSVTGARFVIPKKSDATWTLRVWSHGQLLGKESGTSGTLSVALPAPQICGIQADVQTTSSNGKSRYYSGHRTHEACCPTVTPSSAVTAVVATPTTAVTKRVSTRRISRPFRSGAARRR